MGFTGSKILVISGALILSLKEVVNMMLLESKELSQGWQFQNKCGLLHKFPTASCCCCIFSTTRCFTPTPTQWSNPNNPRKAFKKFTFLNRVSCQRSVLSSGRKLLFKIVNSLNPWMGLCCFIADLFCEKIVGLEYTRGSKDF